MILKLVSAESLTPPPAALPGLPGLSGRERPIAGSTLSVVRLVILSSDVEALAFDEFCEQAILLDELVVSAVFDNVAIFEIQNAVAVLDG